MVLNFWEQAVGKN